MFGSLIDDLKLKVDGMLKLAVAGAIAAAAATVAFFCFAVALFLWMQQTYGTLEAWMALGALFAVLAAIGAIFILNLRRRNVVPAPKPREAASGVSRLLQEPAVLLTGLQIVRTLGVRGMLPIILLGAVAGGLFMNRNGHSTRLHPDQQAEYEADAGLD